MEIIQKYHYQFLGNHDTKLLLCGGWSCKILQSYGVYYVSVSVSECVCVMGA